MMHLGSGLSIPDGGRAKPDRRRGWSELGREPRWTLIAQPTVWPTLVVFVPIVFDHHSPSVSVQSCSRFKHSSRKRPWKLSTKPFCQGLPGSM